MVDNRRLCNLQSGLKFVFGSCLAEIAQDLAPLSDERLRVVARRLVWDEHLVASVKLALLALFVRSLVVTCGYHDLRETTDDHGDSFLLGESVKTLQAEIILNLRLDLTRSVLQGQC